MVVTQYITWPILKSTVTKRRKHKISYWLSEIRV